VKRTILTLCLLIAVLSRAQSTEFDVASVKPSTPGTLGGRIQFLPGGVYRATNVPLNFLILNTYELRDLYQLVGDPRWLAMIADGENARYEIEARGDPQASQAQVREMVKALLADWFQLRVHLEMRDLPIYALIPAKGGIKLEAPKDDGKSRIRGAITFLVAGWIQGYAVQMESLLQVLTRNTDRPVIDKTGFTQPFDFRLTWTPESATDAPADGTCPASFAAFQQQRGMRPETLSCPSIFTAVQDQLGLKLDPQNAPVEVLVIDRGERPSAN
jgi:uncharacterized protein (TIGR03435 family)